MQARRSSLYRRISSVYFKDDFTTGTSGNIVGQSASDIGSWSISKTAPNYVYKDATHGYIRSSVKGNNINTARAIPGAGLSFNQDYLRISGRYYVVSNSSSWTTIAGCNFFCRPDSAESGVNFNFYPRHSKQKAQIRISYPGKGLIYDSGLDKTPVNTPTNFELTVKRLPNNIIEMSLLVGTHLWIDAKQYTLDNKIYTQHSIFAQLRNNTAIGNGRLYSLTVDNKDLGD
jgi:hypothetical protein